MIILIMNLEKTDSFGNEKQSFNKKKNENNKQKEREKIPTYHISPQHIQL